MMEATPDTRSTVKRDNRRKRTLTDEDPYVIGLENRQTSYANNTDDQEDWLSLATADPAFWLRDVDI